MNHRELVLSARKKARFHFLRIPESLQDAIVTGLDTQTLTLHQAAVMTKERGFGISHEAISDYYQAVRRERRIYDATQELQRMFEVFNEQPLEDNLRALTNFLVATAAQRLVDGEVGIKDIDLARVIQAMAKAGRPAPSDREAAVPPGPGGKVVDAEAIKELRKQLGL